MSSTSSASTCSRINGAIALKIAQPVRASIFGDPSPSYFLPHTFCRTSGAGDHGKEGIKTFVDQHECVQKCTLMGMKALKDLEGEEEDAALNGGNNPD
jgi:hypothetical protein